MRPTKCSTCISFQSLHVLHSHCITHITFTLEAALNPEDPSNCEVQKQREKMGDEKDAFYVVRKGDVVGVYRSINDLQSVLQSSVNDHSVNVFKGYGLSKESEDYLSSHGLKNAIYCVDASDVQDDLFGQLITCPYREPNSSKDKSASKNHLDKKPQEVVGSASFPPNSPPIPPPGKLDNFLQVPPISSYCFSCIIEFDGASKGNPGLAGAGAVVRVSDGRVYRLRESVGIATNNVAEYRGAILGLKFALSKGFKHVRVQGDSKLVCMQVCSSVFTLSSSLSDVNSLFLLFTAVQGLWRTKTQNMTELCKDSNTEADAQANLGVHLKAGEVQVELDGK
ncbi:Hop-interacting protein THI034 [Striga asiatica]|uniref:Hop-interacting protein THI034 n=1 Tax=Striga asiatica TaxID=4170 RepID=A0A5A7PSH4_STRAF|nr:Hop-interacting protein THI034 [Striga asiatica]